MTVHSEHLKDGQRIPPTGTGVPWNKIAACVAWAVGGFTTWLFVSRAAPDLNALASAALALTAQALLTLAEKPLFRRLWGRGGRVTLLGLLSVAADTLLNAAGIYPFVGGIARTDLGMMLVQVFGVRPAVDPLSAFLIAVVAGAIVAGMPEGLWEG